MKGTLNEKQGKLQTIFILEYFNRINLTKSIFDPVYLSIGALTKFVIFIINLILIMFQLVFQ